MTIPHPLRLAVYLSVFAAAAALLPAHAGSEPGAAASFPAGFLDARGRLDLDALLASSYRGPIDLAGLQVTGEGAVDRERFRAVEALDRQRESRPVDEQGGRDLAPNGDPGCWSDQFPVPGIAGYVSAAVVYDGRLVVAGGFDIAGGLARNIAAWDGVAWSPLGSGTNGTVSSLAVWNGLLVAGGWFTIAGGVGANRIAAWSGSAWSPLGAGMSGSVAAMAVDGTDLIAAGQFTVAGTVYANRIARWDGAEWSALGDGLNEDGDAVTVFDGDVVVAGYFTAAGTTVANGIAAWDGGAWSALGPGTRWGGIRSLAVYGGELVAGGEFEDIGLAGPAYLATWDGAAWSGLGAPQDKSVGLMGVIGNELYIGTNTWPAVPGGGSSPEVRHWNGATWTTILETEYSVSAFTGWGGELATFLPVGSNFTVGATWNGSTWSLLPNPGIDNDVKVATVYQGDLVIAGAFHQVGSIEAHQIARWDGVTWSPLGGGIPDGGVHALKADGTDLYVGGSFTSAGGVTSRGIARWDGSSWHALGTGVAGGYADVDAIEKHGGLIFAGGDFFSADGVPAYNIAAWSGAAWETLDTGAVNPVSALLSRPEGLVVGIDGASSPLALWDGSQWTDLGLNPADSYGYVYAISEYGGDLVIGGSFDYANYPNGYYGIARWDGGAWVNLGAGLSGASLWDRPQVHALVVHDGMLIAGGYFGLPGTGTIEHLAAWNGSDWASVGGGVSPIYGGSADGVVACLASWGSQLVVGGNFVTAGGLVSSQLAVWDCTIGTGVPELTSSLGANGFLPAFPNPFGAATTIRYQLASRAPVELTVYDVAGRLVRTLGTSTTQPAGQYATRWDGRNASGRLVSPGTYFVRLRAGATRQTSKLTVLR